MKVIYTSPLTISFCHRYFLHFKNIILIEEFYLMERKGLYGSIAGFTASVTLQPLENIKTVLLVPPK